MLLQIMMKVMRTFVDDGGGRESGQIIKMIMIIIMVNCSRPVVEGGGGEEDGQGGEGPKQDATNHVEVGEVSKDSNFFRGI